MSSIALMKEDHSSYDPAYFERLYAVEDKHFWFRARNEVIATVARQVTAGLAPGYRVLEVGCGTGNVLRMLEEACPDGDIMGMDLFGEGLHFARRRTTCTLLQGDILEMRFDRPFHLIGLFDVLEHLPDDVQVLRALHTALEPNGSLLLTVPAHASLWSYFDEASHHCRRYEASDLIEKLRSNGFHVDYLTPYMSLLFPLVWAGRRAAQALNRGANSAKLLATRELRSTPVVNGILYQLLRQEARLIRRRKRLPQGTSFLVIARRRDHFA